MARASAVRMPPEANAAHGCEGARRVLALLLTFSADDNTLTARQLAERTGIALPSVYRYITLLRETGLLAGDERGSYRLSARLIGLARAAEAAESIIDVANPVMHDLAKQTGETVILVRLIGRSAVCVHRVQSAQQLRITFEPGQSLPLERGASARLLLASLAPNVRKEYLTPLAERDPEAAALLEENPDGGSAGLRHQRGGNPHGGVGGLGAGDAGQARNGRTHRAVTAGPGACRTAGAAAEPGQVRRPGDQRGAAQRTDGESASRGRVALGPLAIDVAAILPACRNSVT